MLSNGCEGDQLSLLMGEKHEAMFPTIGFLACQILGIVGSQGQIETIFSLVRILTILRRCCLPLENLEKLILAI